MCINNLSYESTLGITFGFLLSFSTAIIIPIRNMARYRRKNSKPVNTAIAPKSGGIRDDPIYALATCNPTTAAEYSFPKCPGVSCTRQGKIGAQPKPIKKNPIIYNTLAKGINVITIPRARST